MIIITELDNGILAEGHADYAPRGSDIVCAGVTALVEGFILSVENLTPNTPIFEMSPGYTRVKIGSPTEATKLLQASFFIGVENIAEEFPEHVRVARLERR